ncbi:CDP-paratose 2-epimerase [Candidatus Woesebacteria bacterium RIFCSPLOWO2_01_FULL_38_20]|nr:MAG: CDP-paratose 2-epimerase [Candidatus Woesebacteria bacterium RIFCSPLOWO2_01_FULL_38_20]
MRKKSILITGGTGFIGSNLASYFLKKKYKVVVLDNFSRKGSVANEKWLKGIKGDLRIVKADVTTDRTILQREVNQTDAVIHLAAQVAVTTSVENPRNDFIINALGTFNVLEAIRKSKNKPPIIYSSTNKVYGGMENTKIKSLGTRYIYKDFPLGISENVGLDFHSPYGCSKGAADQYVRDYARIYGLKTVVFRQSCIYGPRQFGVEDQGWVAWFIIAATLGKSVTVYGDGKQVRDLLYIDDLVQLYCMALDKIESISGQVYNIGGGPKFTLSVWKEFKPLLEKNLQMKIKSKSSIWRPGDQKIYVSDIRKVKKEIGWSPKISVEEGVKRLCLWVKENRVLFDEIYS